MIRIKTKIPRPRMEEIIINHHSIYENKIHFSTHMSYWRRPYINVAQIHTLLFKHIGNNTILFIDTFLFNFHWELNLWLLTWEGSYMPLDHKIFGVIRKRLGREGKEMQGSLSRFWQTWWMGVMISHNTEQREKERVEWVWKRMSSCLCVSRLSCHVIWSLHTPICGALWPLSSPPLPTPLKPRLHILCPINPLLNN